MLTLAFPASIVLPGVCSAVTLAVPPDAPAPLWLEPELQVVSAPARPDIRDLPPVARMRCPPFARAARTRICNLSRVS